MDENLASAKALLTTITQLKEQAEASARAAEEANSKANSESGFAFNAKQNAEDHAKAISQVRGTVDADFTWLTTTKKNAEELLLAITVAKTASDADARIAAESRAKIEKEAATVKAASERVSTVLSVIEKTQNDVTAALSNVTAESATVAVAKATVEASAKAVQSLQIQVNEIASKANVDGAAIAKMDAESKSLLASINEVVVMAKSTHESVAEYQKELISLTKAFNELHSKIEGLLPNATSAGLASAFRNQKERFMKPQKYWLAMFVVTIVLLLVTGIVGLPGVWPDANSGTQDSWDSILRHLAIRLPLVAPLVWLAIYAGRHYTLALRVEEEYAFKEAVSTSFEGYKREMAGISDISDSAHPPIVTLCENVLLALAQRPGRIYEGRHEDITPLSPVAKMAEKAMDLASKAVGSATDAVKK